MDGSTQEYRDLLFNVRRSIRYHSRRQRHYQNIHNCVLFLALVLSSASMVTLATEIGQDWDTWVKLLPGALVSGFVGFDFVVGSMQKAWLHADFMRQFTDLERQLVSSDDEHNTVVTVTDKMLEIESSEPPVLHVLNTICYNELMRAMGYSQKEQVAVGWFQRRIANFRDWNEDRLFVPTDATRS